MSNRVLWQVGRVVCRFTVPFRSDHADTAAGVGIHEAVYNV